MKISPVSSSANSIGSIGSEAPAPAQTLRNIKMSTNATPAGRDMPPAQVEELPPAQTLAKEDANEPGEGDDATKPLSPQYAALAKQKRALQVKERELADREKALVEAGKNGSTVDLAKFKANPGEALDFLLSAGITYDQLAEAVIARNDGVTPKVQSLEAKIKELETGFDQKLTERDQQAKQQALADMRREALTLAKDDSFELVRTTNSIDQVMTLIERTYDKTGEVLDVREALQLVEDELSADVDKLLATKKAQAKAQPQPPAPPQQRTAGMRTLTNRDTAQPPMSAKQRAIAAFYGQLKK